VTARYQSRQISSRDQGAPPFYEHRTTSLNAFLDRSLTLVVVYVWYTNYGKKKSDRPLRIPVCESGQQIANSVTTYNLCRESMNPSTGLT
jgi:hypothetical protein